MQNPTGFEITNFIAGVDAALHFKCRGFTVVIRCFDFKLLVGFQLIIAESFERIHRSNLVGMGVLPLQFIDGQNIADLGLTGHETINIKGINDELKPNQRLEVEAIDENGKTTTFNVQCRIDTRNEISYFKAGGILHYVLRELIAK